MRIARWLWHATDQGKQKPAFASLAEIAKGCGLNGKRCAGDVEISLRRAWTLIQRGRVAVTPPHPAWRANDLERRTLLLVRHLRDLLDCKNDPARDRLAAIISAVDAIH